jgi:hypothetical protein
MGGFGFNRLAQPYIEDMEEGERVVRYKGGERESSEGGWELVQFIQLLELRGAS